MQQRYAARVSVVIPAYNAASTITGCLRALQHSEHPISEIIVVDDGSTDGTSALVESADGVTLLRQPNAGSGAAKNRGARAARGEYLCFLDADVEVLPDTVSEFVTTARRHEVDMVLGRYSTEPLNSGWVPHYKAVFDYVYFVPRHLRDSVYIDGQIGGGCDFVSRSAFETLGGFTTDFDGANVEREEFYVRFYEHGFRSAANPAIRTRHHFPGFLALLRNYRQRIRGTLQVTRGQTGTFTYIQRTKLGLPAVFGAGVPLGFFIPAPYNTWAVFMFLSLYLASCWDFFFESLKRKGLLTTVSFVPLHYFMLAYIATVAIFNHARLILEKCSHGAGVSPR